MSAPETQKALSIRIEIENHAEDVIVKRLQPELVDGEVVHRFRGERLGRELAISTSWIESVVDRALQRALNRGFRDHIRR